MPIIYIYYHGSEKELKEDLKILLPKEDWKTEWRPIRGYFDITLPSGYRIYYKGHCVGLGFNSLVSRPPGMGDKEVEKYISKVSHTLLQSKKFTNGLCKSALCGEQSFVLVIQ